MVEVTNVFPVMPYRLIVEFDYGREYRVFDVSSCITPGTVFAPLKDQELFRQARFDPEAHTVVWPGDVDIAPEALYEEGVPLTLPISGTVDEAI